MRELTTTRSNEMIDPLLQIWGWEIPVYLFLGGLVAGMMIISGYFLFKGNHEKTQCSCLYLPSLSIIFLSLGMLALFLDLEHKLYVWRMYTTFQISSPMSWGSWILVLVYPAILANMLLNLPEYFKTHYKKLLSLSEQIKANAPVIKLIGIINIILGIMLGIYTGVLLSSFGARPLWNSSILPILFLFSGLSSAAAFVHMIAKDVNERELLAKADNGFLVSELFIIMLFIVGLLGSTDVQIQSAKLLLDGHFAASFWIFVISLGIVIPLIIQLLAVNHKIKHAPVAPILVIAGGLILRFVIVDAGLYSHWTNFLFGK